MELFFLCAFFPFMAGCIETPSGPPPVPVEQTWEIGPYINGESYSPGMPRYMQDYTFAFPACGNPPHPRGPSVHYVTRAAGAPIDAKTRIRIVYEITGTGRVIDAESGAAKRNGGLSLYFQRRGDDWSADGEMATYRWWSRSFAPVTPGVHTLDVPLFYEEWTPVYGTARTVGRFRAAKDNAARVGFTFGGSSKGHGNCVVDGNARFRLRGFTVVG